MKIRQLVYLAAAALAVPALQAQACGEVMYRMGGALHYRAFITKHPAQIILYENGSVSSTDVEQFHHNLEKAGHKVTVVASAQAFAQALAAHPYDVIIGYAADLPVINAQIEHAGREPTLIPVFAPGNEDRATKQYPLALTEDANLNDFLKTIEKSMKARGT